MVSVIAVLVPISDVPVLSATIGIFISSARIAAVENATTSLMPSMCRPIALTRGSSSKTLM